MRLSRAMADAFRERNQSITCMTLLGLRKAEKSARPSDRTPDYYKSRPCLKMILDALRYCGGVFSGIWPGKAFALQKLSTMIGENHQL